MTLGERFDEYFRNLHKEVNSMDRIAISANLDLLKTKQYLEEILGQEVYWEI